MKLHCERTRGVPSALLSRSCFVASTTRDFRTFTVNPLAEVARRSPKGDGAPVRMVAMLFKTNLFAVVLEESPHTVLIWNDEANRAVGELRSRYEVKGLALRRDVVAVVSEYRVILYSAAKFSVVRQLETYSCKFRNTRGSSFRVD